MPAQGRFVSIISPGVQAPTIVLSASQQLASLPPAQRAMMLQRIQQQQAAVARPAAAATPPPAAPAANLQAAAPATPPPAAAAPVRAAVLVAPVNAVSPEEADRKELEGLRKRAEEKQGSAQYSLALRYLQGRGVEKDVVQARQWLEAAVAGGYTRAASKLAELGDLKTPPAEPPAK